MWKSIERMNSLRMIREEEDAEREFQVKSERIHTVSQLLRAYGLYEKDKQYVVQNSRVMIVDENTGRLMPGRRWSNGLHQAVEAKENVQIEKETKTYMKPLPFRIIFGCTTSWRE